MIFEVLGVLVLAALGMPLFAVIAGIALLGFHAAGYDLVAVAVEYYRLGDKPGLIAIPMFTLAGYLLGESGTPKRLVRLSLALLGWLPGGLAIVAIVACAFFTAFTGASGMTIVAIGAFLFPALVKANYPRNYSLGLVTSSGSLGLLFAPSLPLILFGFVAGQLNTTPTVTVQSLFLAGLLPGLLMVGLLMLHAMWVGRGLPKAVATVDLKEVRAALWDAKWELPLPLVVLGGIYSGKFAASEAAATSLRSTPVAAFGKPRPTHIACSTSSPTISAPGSRPATNRSCTVTVGVVLSWPATKPNRISGSDGANNRPRLPDEVTRPRL